VGGGGGGEQKTPGKFSETRHRQQRNVDRCSRVNASASRKFQQAGSVTGDRGIKNALKGRGNESYGCGIPFPTGSVGKVTRYIEEGHQLVMGVKGDNRWNGVVDAKEVGKR